MGPACMSPRGKQPVMSYTEAKRSLEDAPPLVPGQDRQKWRCDVFSWMELISKRAEVKDKKSIATQAKFAYVLYDAVHPSYQKVLDHAKDSGALSSEGQSFRQRAVVEQIIELIGRDTPLEIIDRLLSAYQHVHTCVRHEKEEPSKYATRFRGLINAGRGGIGRMKTNVPRRNKKLRMKLRKYRMLIKLKNPRRMVLGNGHLFFRN